MNRELLQKTYDYALTLSTEGVTESAAAYFAKVLEEAGNVLDNLEATQEEVDAAWNNLLEGIWGLGVVQGDKTNLELLIERAEDMTAQADRYVETNWQMLLDALTAAKEVYENGDALEEDVTPAADELLDAILMQRYKANKENLQGLVDSLKDMDLTKYTDESVAVFNAALAQANEVLADESLSVDDQAVVDQAETELAAARDALVLKEDPGDPGEPSEPSEPGDPSDPSDPGEPSEPSDPGNPSDPSDGKNPDDGAGDDGAGDQNGNGSGSQNGSGGSSSENGSTAGNSADKAAKTGDSSSVAGASAAMLAAAALAGGMVIVRRKRR